MATLKERLNTYLKSPELRSKIKSEMVKNKDFGSGNGSGGAKGLAENAALELTGLVLESVNDNIDSERGKLRLCSAVRSRVHFETGVGWIADVYFDDTIAHSKSLSDDPKYAMGAYLPTLFNNGYTARYNVSGYDDHGRYWARSRKHRDAGDFIRIAADTFNMRHADSKTQVEYNEIYSGGTLGRGDLARGIF